MITNSLPLLQLYVKLLAVPIEWPFFTIWSTGNKYVIWKEVWTNCMLRSSHPHFRFAHLLSIFVNLDYVSICSFDACKIIIIAILNILYTLSSSNIELVIFHYTGIELNGLTLKLYFNWQDFFRIKELIFEVVKFSFAEAWLDENRRIYCYNWSFNWALTWILTLIGWCLW